MGKPINRSDEKRRALDHERISGLDLSNPTARGQDTSETTDFMRPDSDWRPPTIGDVIIMKKGMG